MNTFGEKYKVTIFGESHGQAIGVVIDGVPSGIALGQGDFITSLQRRRNGELDGRKGLTKRTETDQLHFIAGLYNGYTTGAPLTILVYNEDIKSADYTETKLHPRPSHADWVVTKKHSGYNDHRGGGTSSGRLTVGLVIAGVVAQKILPKEISIKANTTEIGGEKNKEKWGKLLDNIKQQGDSIGGIVECWVEGVKVGVGEPFFDSVESTLAHLLFSIPAIKAVEFGSGFGAAGMKGTQHNDTIINPNGKTLTNHSGGIVGGVANGNPINFRVAVKPTPSISATQNTMKFTDTEYTKGNIEELKISGRHDSCIALRVPVVVESIAAIALKNIIG